MSENDESKNDTSNGEEQIKTPSQTPSGSGKGLATPTPLRDKLAINPDEGFDEHDRFQQRELQATLMQGLSSLPQPKNDFEIVVPEDEDLNEVPV